MRKPEKFHTPHPFSAAFLSAGTSAAFIRTSGAFPALYLFSLAPLQSFMYDGLE